MTNVWHQFLLIAAAISVVTLSLFQLRHCACNQSI